MEKKEEEKLKTLILGGGGHRGGIHIGVIKYLDENNILGDINKFIGSSIGSLFSLVLALNYNYKEIFDIFFMVSPQNLHNVNTSTILSFTNTYGIDNCKKIGQFIKILLTHKGYNPYITFKELYEKTNKHFMCSVTDIARHRNVLLDHNLVPDMPVWLGIRASMTLPLIFPPIYYKEYIFIDGSITCDIPIHILTEEEVKTTLCIKISLYSKEINDVNIDSIHTYIMRIYNTMNYRQYLLLHDKIIRIAPDNIHIIQNTITTETKYKMIDIGYNAIKNHYNSLTNLESPDDVLSPS